MLKSSFIDDVNDLTNRRGLICDSLKGSSLKLSYMHSIMLSIIALSDAIILFSVGILILYLSPDLGLNEKVLNKYSSVTILVILSTLIVFYLSDLYSHDIRQYYKSQGSKIVLLLSLIYLSLIIVAFSFKVSDQYSRTWLFGWYFLSTTLICFDRYLFTRLLKFFNREGKLRRNIVLIGGGEQGERMLKYLEDRNEPWMSLSIFDDRVNRLANICQYPIIGNIEDLIKQVRAHKVDEILVALPWQAEKRTLEILKRLQELPIRVRLCPDLVGFNFLNSDYSLFGGVPVMHIYDKPIDGWDFIIKSIEDKTLALLSFILVFPVLLFVALLVKLDSKGPVFFRQNRYGFNNELIEVLKFRTMRTDMQDNNAETLVTKNDPRVTRIGNILRRTSLDELPQIINVLKGEMSMVGPRPHATKAKAAGKYYQDVVSEYAHRHKVKPGISGWAQVNGWRGETDTEEKIIKRVEYDLYYINHWSLGLDIYILLKTLLVVFRSENAY